jgi:hypothetical protein
MLQTTRDAGTVQITEEWVQLGSKTYLTSDIKSARMLSVWADPARDVAYATGSGGLILFLGAINVVNGRFVSGGWAVAAAIVAVIGLLLSIVGMLVMMSQLLRGPNYVYIVSLRGSFGRETAYASPDRAHVEKIVSDINALAGKGPRNHMSKEAG